MLSLLLSIFIPVILFLAIAISLFVMWMTSKKAEGASKGTLIFRLDIANRKIRRYDRKSNYIQNKYVFNKRYSKDWLPLSVLTDNFKGTIGEREFRNALVVALTNEQTEFSFTTSKVIKKEKVKFKVVINQVDGGDIHTMYISWDVASKTEEINIESKKFTKLELAENTALYKGFIGFALNSNISNVEQIFARDFAKIFRFQTVQLFFAKGLACIPFFENDRRSAEKKMDKFIKILKNRGYRLGINRLTFGSGKLLSKDVNTPKRVNTILKTLDFLVNLSIRNGQDFLDSNSEFYSSDEYVSYVEAAQIFRVALRAGDVKSIPISVRKYDSKRKVIEYVVPTIENVSNELLVSILRNDYNRSNLIDVQAKNISIENKLTRPSLFDVNVKWLFDNKDKINVKKAIYVLNFPGTVEQEHIDAIIKLKERGFIFAIRLKAYNEQVSTLVMKVVPQFIVVDKILSSDAATSSFIQLVSIKKIADHEKARLIFENPSPDIDAKWAEKIGLDFYYEF